MYDFSEREREYMDLLDEVYCEGYGLLLYKGDPIAWNVGFNDWQRETHGDLE